MARPLRIEFANALYHVTSRGNDRQKIFLDAHDNRKFLELFGKTLERFNWICHAFCLMENHYHLMIETPDANLSKGMHLLNATFCQAHHKRHDTVGHLLQGRFKAVVVDRESYLLELARYVVLNPVRAGLVARPEDWPWSSYRATAGLPVLPGLGGLPVLPLQPAAQAAPAAPAAQEVRLPVAAATAKATATAKAAAAVDAAAAAEGEEKEGKKSATAMEKETAREKGSGADEGAARGATKGAAKESAKGTAKGAAKSPAKDAAKESAKEPAKGAAAESEFLTTAWLLGQFGPDEITARRRYVDFVASGIGSDSPWLQLQSQLFLGKETFIDTIKETIPEKTAVKEIPKLQRYANRPQLKEIFADFKTRKKRNEAIVESHVTYGFEQKEIANFLGIHYTTVSHVIKRHDEK